ncbi:MAG: hypothetical protein NUK63_06550 [Candidatus Bathyarchaeum tardum]|nr:MAG: hypothetical protein NUK63_06550 [Candidatus Bathyarchaeum tardum]
MLGHRSNQSTDRYTHDKPKAPTKWEVKRAITKEEENQLLSENWTFVRFDEDQKKQFTGEQKDILIPKKTDCFIGLTFTGDISTSSLKFPFFLAF